MISPTLALLGISLLLAPQGTVKGSFQRSEKLLDTSFVDQKPPGYLQTSIQASLQPTVFPISEADVIDYDPVTMTIILPIAPAYAPGEVVVFGPAGQETGVKIVSLTSSTYNSSTYAGEPPTIDDVLTPGDVSIGFTPDFSTALQSGGRRARFLPSTSSGLSVIDLKDTSLFDIKVKADGTIDLQSSTLMGEPLVDAPPGAVQQADTSQVAGGSFSAYVVTGTLELIPTMGLEKKGTGASGTIEGTFEGIARLDLEVEMKATGKVTFSTAAKLFPDLSVTVLAPSPLGPIPITGTLELPAGFDLSAEVAGTARMHYSSEYSYELISTLQNGALTFASQKDNKTKEKDVDWGVTGKIDGRLFVRPEISVKFAYALGGGLWLEPFVSAELEYPWLAGQDELFFGIEGGCSLKVAWLSFYSPDLLGLDPKGFDLFGPTGTPGNTPPTAIATSVTASQATNPLQLEAFDADDDPLVYYLTTPPSHGTLGTLNGQTGQVSYTPEWSYFGPDSFQFKVWDGTAYSLPASVSITVASGSLPKAHFAATNPVSMTGHFDASGSWDAETPKSGLTYRWDFENDDVWDTGFSSSKVIDHPYATEGTKTVELLVKDADGGTNSIVHTVDVTFLPGGSPAGNMAYIPAGSFVMGEHYGVGWSDEKPLHTVSLDAFYMDVFEATNADYAAYLNSAKAQGLITVSGGDVSQAGTGTPYYETNSQDSYSSITWNGSVFSVETGMSNHPVNNVSWYGALAYANWRSSQDGLTPCYDLSTWSCDFGANGYRLPTEAEWEYAARGPSPPYYQYPWGNTINDSQANYYQSGDPYGSAIPPTTPVGYYDGTQTPPGVDMANGFGLYDTSGNLWEWCNDWYSGSYYDISPSSNPHGPSSGSYRVVRGGSWFGYPFYLRSAIRGDGWPVYRYVFIGFRLARVSTQ